MKVIKRFKTSNLNYVPQLATTGVSCTRQQTVRLLQGLFRAEGSRFRRTWIFFIFDRLFKDCYSIEIIVRADLDFKKIDRNLK